MKTTEAFQVPDFSDLFRSTKELASELSKLAAMSKDVAAARTVKEFQTDRKHNAFSKAVMEAFKAGAESTAKAEHMARSSDKYEATMKRLAEDYTAAEEALTNFTVTMAKIESLRSIIGVFRQMAGIDK